MGDTDFRELTNLIQDASTLRRIVISGRRKSHNPKFVRIDIRPVLIKGRLHLQVVSHDGKRDLTKNYLPEEFDLDFVRSEGYANILIERDNEILTIRVTKQGALQIHRELRADSNSSLVSLDLDHDRQKVRLLPPEDPIFRELGVSDSSGRLIAKQNDKYRQVDDFLRIVSSVVKSFPAGPISIADLGCGNAYLTFAVHRYLTKSGHAVRVLGVDNKPESRIRNEKIADALGISSEVRFFASDISEFPTQDISLVMALHACDTATDDAIAWAIKSRAKAILVAPCCHHEINREIKPASANWEPLFRHGIMKERFADLLTDTLRAEILKFHGYRADIIEFVSIDHTPRNLLIRASYTGAPADKRNYEKLCAEWSVEPYLARLLS